MCGRRYRRLSFPHAIDRQLDLETCAAGLRAYGDRPAVLVDDDVVADVEAETSA